VEHRRPGPTDGGVTAMDRNPLPDPDASMAGSEWADLTFRNLLIGGEPGSGKTVLMNLMVVHDVLSSPQDDTTGTAGDPGKA
jgi:hypothetical protein